MNKSDDSNSAFRFEISEPSLVRFDFQQKIYTYFQQKMDPNLREWSYGNCKENHVSCYKMLQYCSPNDFDLGFLWFAQKNPKNNRKLSGVYLVFKKYRKIV